MIGQWLGIAGAVIGVVVFLGAAVSFLRGSRDKGTISTLESSNAALTGRVVILEASEKRLTAELLAADITHKAEVAALNLRLDAMVAEKASLESVRPSSDVLAEVASRVEVTAVRVETIEKEMRRIAQQVAEQVAKEVAAKSDQVAKKVAEEVARKIAEQVAGKADQVAKDVTQQVAQKAEQVAEKMTGEKGNSP